MKAIFFIRWRRPKTAPTTDGETWVEVLALSEENPELVAGKHNQNTLNNLGQS